MTTTSAATDDLTGVAGWAVDVMETLGAPGAGLLVALENLFPPLPSELILPLAGFTASRGGFTLVEAIAWTTAGSVLGALVLYVLAATVGRDRCLALWCRLPLVEEHDFVRTEQWFARHGAKAVLLGRLLPVFRSLVSVPAGVARMPLWQFLAYTLLGSLAWNTLFVLAGFELGEQWHRVEGVVGWVQYVVLGAVALAVAWWVTRRVRSRRAERVAG
jgi:membrane protein DedA with SNARE-associated domain